MKRIKYYMFLFIMLFVAFIVAQESSKPMPISGFADSANYKLYLNETVIATIHYTLDAAGNYQRTFILSMAGQNVEHSLKISVDAQGCWQNMEIKTPTDTIPVNRVGEKAEFKVKDQKYSITLTPGHIIYDHYSPVFEGLMLKSYDMAKKGKQKFSRFILEKMIDVEVEYRGKETRTVAGRQSEFDRFDMNLLGINVQLWADRDSRIAMMDVPVQHAAFVREGFEDLVKVKVEDPLLSKPEFNTRRETAQVPMRDGIKLATDLYFPDSRQDRFPAILIRSPYKKEMSEVTGLYYAKRGYVVAIQDCRGRFASEGTWEPFMDEPRDGYDAVEWLAGQTWSNGKVGMIGGSYVGWVQLWAAAEKPPHLTTIIPNVAPPDPFYNIPYEYGTFFIFGAIWWAEILESNATGDLSGKAMAKIGERKYEQILKQLPVIDLDKKILGKVNPYWRRWIEHNTNDSYWTPANFMDKLKEVDIPVFLQSGWFDGDGIGTKLNYLQLKQSANRFQKVIIGPWGHTDQSSSRLGDYDFTAEAAPDLQTLYLRWFDRWLKGIDNNIEKEPLVQLFSMFSNKWHLGDTYPLPQTQFTKLFIQSDRGANTSKGEGRLTFSAPAAGKEFDAYVYFPGDPTPHPDWYYKSEEETKTEKAKTLDVTEQKKKEDAFHNKVTDARQDILVYQTEPLAEPLTIVGPVSAMLYAASSAPDTDWFVRLMDVDENGKIFPLVHGTLRARFRNSMSKPELLEKDKVYEYKIDMWQTGITFQKGHRIRVEISSAMFPMFSRNLNTGGHNEKEKKFQKASQKVFHSSQYPSHILLPVIDLKK